MFPFWYDHPLFDEEEEPRQERPTFHDFDRDDPWGKQPEHEPRETTDTGDTLFHDFDRDDPFGRRYYPLDDGGKIFNPLASPQPEASTGNLTFVQYAPPEEPPPSPAPRPREISLWGYRQPVPRRPGLAVRGAPLARRRGGRSVPDRATPARDATGGATGHPRGARGNRAGVGDRPGGRLRGDRHQRADQPILSADAEHGG